MGRDMQVTDTGATTGGHVFCDFQRRRITRTLLAMKSDFEDHP